LTKYFTKEELQNVFDKGERRYGSSKNVLPSIIKKCSTGEWEFMYLEEARNLFEAYQEDPNMEIIWWTKEEKDRNKKKWT